VVPAVPAFHHLHKHSQGKLLQLNTAYHTHAIMWYYTYLGLKAPGLCVLVTISTSSVCVPAHKGGSLQTKRDFRASLFQKRLQLTLMESISCLFKGYIISTLTQIHQIYKIIFFNSLTKGLPRWLYTKIKLI